jgi:hypothetical protein
VVSVSYADAPDKVCNNFIYVMGSDGDWWLVASVDFQNHGIGAPPGHWHLNRTPDGELIPHFFAMGPDGKGDVFHGHPTSIPLWWLLIPTDKTYAACPNVPFIAQRFWDD